MHPAQNFFDNTSRYRTSQTNFDSTTTEISTATTTTGNTSHTPATEGIHYRDGLLANQIVCTCTFESEQDALLAVSHLQNKFFENNSPGLWANGNQHSYLYPPKLVEIIQPMLSPNKVYSQEFQNAHNEAFVEYARQWTERTQHLSEVPVDVRPFSIFKENGTSADFQQLIWKLLGAGSLILSEMHSSDRIDETPVVHEFLTCNMQQLKDIGVDTIYTEYNMHEMREQLRLYLESSSEERESFSGPVKYCLTGGGLPHHAALLAAAAQAGVRIVGIDSWAVQPLPSTETVSESPQKTPGFTHWGEGALPSVTKERAELLQKKLGSEALRCAGMNQVAAEQILQDRKTMPAGGKYIVHLGNGHAKLRPGNPKQPGGMAIKGLASILHLPDLFMMRAACAHTKNYVLLTKDQTPWSGFDRSLFQHWQMTDSGDSDKPTKYGPWGPTFADPFASDWDIYIRVPKDGSVALGKHPSSFSQPEDNCIVC